MEIKLNLERNILINQEKEIDEIETNIGELDKKIYSNRTNLIEILDKMNLVKTKITNLDKELANIKLELSSLDKENTNDLKLDNEYYDKSLECELLEKELSDLIKKKDLLQTDILEKEGIQKVNQLNLQKEEKELNNLTILLNKLDNDMDNYLNILNNEYSLTYERAKEEYFLEVESETAYSMVSNFKNELKNIGMVNLDSIGEYESVSERYNYLKNESDDLLHAKDTLYSIIDEMDSVMQHDFLETFKKLEVEFKKVFREKNNF